MNLDSFNMWVKKKNNLSEDFGDDDGEMVKNNLNDIVEYGSKMLELMNRGQEVEEWMKNKITVARTHLSDVTHAYMNKIKNNSCGSKVDVGYLDEL